MAQNVQDILGGRVYLPSQQNTAVFYSITSPLRGLRGIELGNVLIKRATGALSSEMPGSVYSAREHAVMRWVRIDAVACRLDRFVTLSPIPGFRRWLLTKLRLDSSAHFGEDCLLLPEEQASRTTPALSSYLHIW